MQGRDEVIERLDADGDGREDAILLLHTQGRNGAYVLRRDTAQGWAAADLLDRAEHDHFSTAYLGTVRIGGELYFEVGGDSTGSMTLRRCGRVELNDDHAWAQLLRLHPSGDLVPVAMDTGYVESDGTLSIAGIRHRWDAAQFAFVPDEPVPTGLPWFEIEGCGVEGYL